MNRALRTAATGMYAQQLNVDVIANNLANLNTTGYKTSRPEFQDLMYQTLKSSSESENANVHQPVSIQIGTGTTPVASYKSFTQGDLQTTSNKLDVAIQGDGFFQIQRSDGTIAYSRDGAFKVSSDGMIVTSKHVVSDNAKYSVVTSANKTYAVKNIYKDPLNDIAFLKINPLDNPGNSLKPVTFGDSSNLQVGQFVVAIGTALGEFKNTVTTGVISGLGRAITAGDQFQGYVENS